MRKQLVGEINYIKVWQRRINTTSGTKIGGKKAAARNLQKYGENFYRMIGSKGGQKKQVRKGFAMNPALASMAGAKGGRISKRTGRTTGQRKEKEYIWKGGPNETLAFK